jgi:N-acetylmuramoyl-L-alanine amidase
MVIYVAIPGDRNVVQKEAEKNFKYKKRTIKLQRMWTLKTIAMPVISEATGIISNHSENT